MTLSMFKASDYPVSVLYNRAAPEEHYHSELEFSLVLRGTGQYFVRDRLYSLQPGSGLIIHGNEVHYGISSTETSMLRAVLIFDPALVANRPAAIKALEDISACSYFSLRHSESTALELLLKEIQDEQSSRLDGWDNIVACSLERFLLYISRAACSAEPASLPRPNATMLKILEHLESTFRQKQATEDLCSRFGLSSSALRRLFRKHTGLGVKEFIILLRIAESKRLLQQTDAKVSSIAYDVGFDNLSAFNRDFKMAAGMNPSEYRQMVSRI